MGQKTKLGTEQRMQLVLRMLSKEEPAAQIARRAGVAEQTLYRWRDEFLDARGNGGTTMSDPAQKPASGFLCSASANGIGMRHQ